MKTHIQIKLFANLQSFSPPTADKFAIQSGTTVRELLVQLEIEPAKARLIFIDGIKANLDTQLNGGERVGVFPPVGGG